MHPIIALWSHPRSMSTATERIMRERGDLRCFHEPFMYLYYVGDEIKEMPHFEADPEGMIRAWCAATGIEFLPHSLEWDRPPPAEWEKVSGWHSEAVASGGITRDAPPCAGGDAAVTLDNAPQLRRYHEHHLPFYEKLREHRLKPVKPKTN